MSTEEQPSPWSREAWVAQSGAEQSMPTTQQASTPPDSPSAPSGSGEVRQPTPPRAKNRSRAAGILAIALLAGGVGGGLGVTATRAFGPDGSGQGSVPVTQTRVVQADPSNPDWASVAKSAAQAVVAIQVADQDGANGQGSGVVIDAKGHIVTNNHVIAGSGTRARISVTLGNSSYRATVVGTDPSTDLAVIRLSDPPSSLTVMGFGDNTALSVGEQVMAIGNPLGLSDTVTTGIVSALNRPVTTRAVANGTVTQRSDDAVVTAAIQTNAAINPGNSGGALVNTAGELVGITSSIASLPSNSGGQTGNIGIGFAIGADQVKYVTGQLIAKGTAQHPQIGINADDVTSVGPLGARVSRVGEGSPAEKAGLQVGDLVTAVNGAPVSSTESLVALVRAGQVDQPMMLTVIRTGSEESIRVTPVAASS